jgi:hypothetical protein
MWSRITHGHATRELVARDPPLLPVKNNIQAAR